MLNIEEIKKIPAAEFKDYLHSWMDQKDVTRTLQMKLRKQLVTNFQKTELAKTLEIGKQKNLFSSKDYVIDAFQAEHLYHQQNHFTLSVFFTESRHTELLPNFEQTENFRFDKTEIGKLVELLGELLHSRAITTFLICIMISGRHQEKRQNHTASAQQIQVVNK